MSNLSLGEFCYFFCCPPCPAHIASKMAFSPPEPSYHVVPDVCGKKYIMKENNESKLKMNFEDDFSKNVEIFFCNTKRGNRIVCMFIGCNNDESNSKYTLLFSHGNGVDIGLLRQYYVNLSSRLGVNVYCYDYSGYGASGGRPSEKNIYADIRAAFQALQERYSIPTENIVLYGQSIGTAPTIDLAMKHECAAVVLHAPLLSGMRVAFPKVKRTWFFDAFPSIEKIAAVKSPVLVIHGTNDNIIDFSHGVGIYNQCLNALDPLWVKGAGHNDIELYPQYIKRLEKFVNEELPN